jgi:cytochrome c peroxidase
MRTVRRIQILALGAALALGGCGDDEEEQAAQTDEPEAEAEPVQEERPLRELVADTFEALPSEVDVDRNKMLLGRRLYHDPQLSGDGTVSCSTCHMLSHGGAEPRATSVGIRGQTGPINSPTVLNSAYNFRQFWDGRAADLTEQAAGPIGNPIEMDGDWDTILERLNADEEYVSQFQEAYGEDGLTQENVLDAIVQYERYLVTPSAFDRWLGGDDDALTEQQQRGLRLFAETGCTTCHRGRNLGGTMYQKMGLVHDYFERRGGELTEADLGRFNVTGEDADRHKFKVPTLRNVELTSPYFHDGNEQELSGAVRTMAYVQLGEELTDDQVGDIVAFLESLTGELPEDARPPGAAGAEEEAAETEPAEGESAEGESAETGATAAEGTEDSTEGAAE